MTIAIISININRLIFWMKALCGYCVVLTEVLYIVWDFRPLSFNNHANWSSLSLFIEL